jgi:ABC-type sugar transport system ATPase subunit
MARTFQNLQVCMNMSAIENVMVGAHLRQNTGLLAGLLSLPRLRVADRACRAEALEAMAQVGVAAFADAHASQMPYGALKRLEIARALMTRPRMVLMDEPAAGLNPTETAEVGQLIRRLADQGLTVLLVEHDMPLVMRVSNTITVLNYGKKLAEGTPEEMRSHPEVIAAYLGAEVRRARTLTPPARESRRMTTPATSAPCRPCRSGRTPAVGQGADQPLRPHPGIARRGSCVGAASWSPWSAPTARERPRCCARFRVSSP